MEWIWKILGFFFFSSTSSAAHFNDENPSDCQINNTACNIHEDNLIETIQGIYTLLECREICLDNPSSECEFITYFDQSGSPLKNSCQLFRSCETTVDCTGSDMETGFLNKGLFGKFLLFQASVFPQKSFQVHDFFIQIPITHNFTCFLSTIIDKLS